MIKSITIHPCTKDKTKCCVQICDLPTGKNKNTIFCSLESVADIVKCNLNDNVYG